MSLKEDLVSEVAAILREQWSKRDGQVVPTEQDLKLGNDAVNLDAVVLYADMTDSTSLVDNHTPEFAAEVYKVFLHCAAKIIRDQGGEITAYDGDRVMAVFIGDSKNSSAAKCALKINYARSKIINPAIVEQYPKTQYRLEYVVGIDSSKLLVARTGIRGANDLVWVGRAANHAAKLCDLGAGYPAYITEEVYDMLHKASKFGPKGEDMWTKMTWNATGRTIYGSAWTWSV